MPRRACNVPVFRYALERWNKRDADEVYSLYVFHGQPPLDEKQKREKGYLDRRARKNRPFDIAERQHQAALRIGHGDGARMPAFHQRAAQDLDQDGITHW